MWETIGEIAFLLIFAGSGGLYFFGRGVGQIVSTIGLAVALVLGLLLLNA